MRFKILPDSFQEGFRTFIKPLVDFMIRFKISPNFYTTVSLLLCAISGYQFGKGSLRLAAFLLLLGGLFDVFDGAVARATNRVTKFGALYDSTLDRYAEFMVFFGICFYFLKRYLGGYELGLLISMFVVIGIFGSLMVSYVRARAEGLGFECKVGLMQRPERIVLIGVCALISEFALILAIFVIAVFANLTAIQRLHYIWQIENSAKWESSHSKVEQEDLFQQV
ncbi:CDP-alcohol phosphatidyltransferase family protein [candidate division KSB1 bacterium]|nr:CDP-alcohol phosphatidyltransferase family protein [candidate division KSB1 bacterium]